MLTQLGLEIVHDLKHDPLTREHFSIQWWTGKGTCDTVGCIAGTALLRSADSADRIRLRNGEGITPRAAELLGVDTRSASHLFDPGLYSFHNMLRSLSHNERPSAARIGEIEWWFENSHYMAAPERFTPSICAFALEGMHEDHPTYPDWFEAAERGRVFDLA